MQKDLLTIKILKIALLITLIGIILFAFLALVLFFTIHIKFYSLLLGWLIGSIMSISMFFIKSQVMKRLFTKNITKKPAFWLSMFYTFGYMLVALGCLIGILEIDFWYSGKTFFVDHSSIGVVNHPINLFTFIAGFHVIMFGIFISHYVNNKKIIKNGKKAKQNMRGINASI